MPVEHAISAEEFWSHYFERDFVQLHRHSDGRMSGVYLDFGDEGKAWVGREQEFVIDRAALAAYDTEADEGFAARPCAGLKEALLAVIQGDRFREDTVPNRRQLHLVVRLLRDPRPTEFSDVQRIQTTQALDRFSREEITRTQLVDLLKLVVPGRDQAFEEICRVLLDALTQKRISAGEVVEFLASNDPPASLSYPILRVLLLRIVSGCEPRIERGCQLLDALRPTPEQYAQHEEGGELAAIHVEREVLYEALALCPARARIATVLLEALKNHLQDDLFVIISVIQALGAHNHKSAIEPLVQCLAEPAMKRYREEIERSLQLLCSGNRLLCRAVFAEPVKTYTEEELARANADPNWDPLLEFDYWRAQLAGLPASATDWFQHDLSSVFWEKRLRCALSAGGLQIPAQQLVSLQSDEVAAIRDLAPKSG